jgi:hypothetical protein
MSRHWNFMYLRDPFWHSTKPYGTRSVSCTVDSRPGIITFSTRFLLARIKVAGVFGFPFRFLQDPQLS